MHAVPACAAGPAPTSNMLKANATACKMSFMNTLTARCAVGCTYEGRLLHSVWMGMAAGHTPQPPPASAAAAAAPPLLPQRMPWGHVSGVQSSMGCCWGRPRMHVSVGIVACWGRGGMAKSSTTPSGHGHSPFMHQASSSCRRHAGLTWGVLGLSVEAVQAQLSVVIFTLCGRARRHGRVTAPSGRMPQVRQQIAAPPWFQGI